MGSSTGAIHASPADGDQLLEIANRAAAPPFDLGRADALIRELADARRVETGGPRFLRGIGAPAEEPFRGGFWPGGGPRHPPPQPPRPRGGPRSRRAGRPPRRAPRRSTP